MTLIKLLSRWPKLESLFNSSLIELKEAGLPTALCTAIKHFNWQKVEEDLDWEKSTHHHILTLEDSAYPALLREIHDPPPVLYAKGELEALGQKTVAMIGTRKPSVTGSEIAWQFARELAESQIALVSGLALGIDGRVHEGCLAAKGRTIAVMGTGIDRIYPWQHRQLAEKISQSGLLISEFPLKTPPASGHFPRRNRIISGLSLITVVVEAAIKSGSLITAGFALEQNRDVLAIPGSIYNSQSRGCHHLLQQGAKLVSSAQEILQELGVESLRSEDKTPRPLATSAGNLVKFIGFETTSIDALCQRTGLTIDKVTCFLADLELQGLIKTVTGGYTRCSE